MSIIEFRPTMPAGSIAKAHAESISRGAEMVQLLIAVIRVARKRARDRAELSQMGDLALHDLGLSPCSAWHDVRRPFWQDVQKAWRAVAQSQRHYC